MSEPVFPVWKRLCVRDWAAEMEYGAILRLGLPLAV